MSRLMPFVMSARRAGSVVAGLLAATVAPCVALAADLAVGQHPATVPSKEGMPQLNFANPLTTSQIVWMFVIFVALYLMLSRWALPLVGEVVDARANAIAGDLDTAREAKAEADAAVAELTEATRRARAESQSQIDAAVTRAREAAAQEARAFNERLEAQLAAAEQRIGQARSSAMGALREVAADTAGVVVQRLTGQTVDARTANAVVGDVMAARGHA